MFNAFRKVLGSAHVDAVVARNGAVVRAYVPGFKAEARLAETVRQQLTSQFRRSFARGLRRMRPSLVEEHDVDQVMHTIVNGVSRGELSQDTAREFVQEVLQHGGAR